VPEEKNRRVIDAISSINMPYTEQSKKNLVREGLPTERIVVTGNPIYEVLQHYAPQIHESTILEQLELTAKGYVLVTTHRAENVDHAESLNEIMEGLNQIAEKFGQRVICSIHPRTKSRIQESLKLQMHSLVEFHEPFGFFDFVKLEQHARLVLTDSGTVQEECCIFQVPTVTIRNSTERPETIDCGSNVVCGVSAKAIVEAAVIMSAVPSRWECPVGYLADHVSDKVIKFLLGGKLHV
jgi:UDP-N-acetylglucosamine 2-epimerase (non-hydrolysing)